MKSVRLQLLVAVVAMAIGEGILFDKGLPPEEDFSTAIQLGQTGQVRRDLCWGPGDVGQIDATRTLSDCEGSGKRNRSACQRTSEVGRGSTK